MLTIRYVGPANSILPKHTAWTLAKPILTCHSAGPRLPGTLVAANCTSFNYCNGDQDADAIRYVGPVNSILPKRTAWTRAAKPILDLSFMGPRLHGGR